MRYTIWSRFAISTRLDAHLCILCSCFGCHALTKMPNHCNNDEKNNRLPSSNLIWFYGMSMECFSVLFSLCENLSGKSASLSFGFPFIVLKSTKFDDLICRQLNSLHLLNSQLECIFICCWCCCFAKFPTWAKFRKWSQEILENGIQKRQRDKTRINNIYTRKHASKVWKHVTQISRIKSKRNIVKGWAGCECTLCSKTKSVWHREKDSNCLHKC